MPSFNKCVFIGNLGKDPEIRYTPNGKSVATFSVAVNRSHKNADGEWEQSTEWINAVLFGDSAERAADNLHKGNLVLIEGRQETQHWTDKETGKPASRVVHILSNWQNLTKKEGDGGRGPDVLDTVANDPRHEGAFVGAVPTPSSTSSNPDLDDLPF